MRIVFMGTPEFAVPSLEILLENGYSVPAVVSAPDKPQGRGRKTGISLVKRAALERSIPVLQPDQLNDPGFLEHLKTLNPELIVVVAFRILPREVFSVARHGAFNLHASLLPKYRGAAPIQWAIIKGERETGVTTFFLDDKVDTGSILLQARVKIGADETAGELQARLAHVGAEIVLQTVRLTERGKARPRIQDEALATPAPKIFKDDCAIAWGNPREAVHNFVRGLSPVPGAWTTFKGRLVRIFRTTLSAPPDSGQHREPGTILDVSNGLSVCTGNGSISVVELQQEGRRRMQADEFLRGFKIQAGEKFG